MNLKILQRYQEFCCEGGKRQRSTKRRPLLGNKEVENECHIIRYTEGECIMYIQWGARSNIHSPLDDGYSSSDFVYEDEVEFYEVT